MTVFLDTNIILDVLLERPGYEAAVQLFQLQEKEIIRIGVSVLTMVNVAYVYRKTVGQELATVNLKYLSTFLEVLPIDNEMLQTAIYLDSRDFEDAFQAVCASAGNCNAIVTHNPKDFLFKKGLSKPVQIPPVYTPAAFLQIIR